MAVSAVPVLLLAVLLPMALRFNRRNGTLALRVDTRDPKILQRKGNRNEKSFS
jgi:hypothetical protein